MSATQPVDPVQRRSGYVDSEGERIYYEVTGDGPPIVLCHGLGGNHAIWWRQIEALATNHTLVTWDQRGFGNSTARSQDIGPPAARRDLRVLLDHLDLTDVTLVGQSMGGWTALGYALENPSLLRALILSTTLAGAEPTEVENLVNTEPERNRMNRREHPVLSTTFCRENPDLSVLYNQISSFGAKPDPAMVLSTMANDRLDLQPLESLSVPTLVLMAADDALCPPSAMHATAARLPAGTLQIVRGSHSVYYENPVVWNEAVLAFSARARNYNA